VVIGMGLFGKKTEGGMMDVIRCDQEDYLVWKWRPSGAANSTSKENGIRWGSSLRVKDGEVAVFVYKQADGQHQDFIEGPFDETIKTANFPVLSSIVGLAFGGQAPFQAEVYFINLAGNIRMPIGVPYFDVFDPRFMDFPVKVAVRGSLVFNITDYRGFIKLHRLINFELERFRGLVRDAVVKYIKGIVSNAPADNGIPVLQIERKLLEINDLVKPRVAQAFAGDFGVNLQRLDIDVIEIDKATEEYRQLRSITADLEISMRQKQNDIALRNLDDTQSINAGNMAETLRIQREESQRFQRLQTETQFIAAHQLDQQTGVLRTAAANLGEMSTMNLGTGGGGFNPVGMMTGLAVGGVMGGQMASMMNGAGAAIAQPPVVPPPLPQVQYSLNINGQTTGPFMLNQLQELVRNGQLTPATYAWKPGMANWDSAGNLADLAALFAAAAPPPPPPPLPPLPPAAPAP
jgi:membrane protease subunit (stomatin/prohibitin family)